MQFYELLHDTTYRYTSPVLLSQQVAHLRPRESLRQRLVSYVLEIDPAPAHRPHSTRPRRW